jgi:hypothetical protein
MENQETIQEQLNPIYEDITKVLPTYESIVQGENKKDPGCKTCKNKDFATKSSIKIFTLGGAVLFFTFYGLVSCFKDILSFFTR